MIIYVQNLFFVRYKKLLHCVICFIFKNKYREEGERYMSTFHYDMRSKEIDQARKASQLASQVSNLKIKTEKLQVYLYIHVPYVTCF